MFQGCVAVISLTWITSVAVFSMLVLPRGGYYFNPTGMIACEPFYSRPSIRILTACGFYFPTTMLLMYCYGSAFHVNKLRLRSRTRSSVAAPHDCQTTTIQKVFSHVTIIPNDTVTFTSPPHAPLNGARR